MTHAALAVATAGHCHLVGFVRSGAATLAIFAVAALGITVAALSVGAGSLGGLVAFHARLAVFPAAAGHLLFRAFGVVVVSAA